MATPCPAPPTKSKISRSPPPSSAPRSPTAPARSGETPPPERNTRAMGTYLARRLLQSVLVLLAVSLLAFGLIYLSGDPVRAMVPLDATPQDVENIRHGFGLDQPNVIQYV